MASYAARGLSPTQGLPTSVLYVIGAAVLLCLTVPKLWLAVAAATIAAISIVGYIGISLLRGDATAILCLWVLVFPLGYHFMQFPNEQPLVTFDRVVVGGLLVAITMLGRSSDRIRQLIQPFRGAAIAWAIFLAVATLTLALVASLASSARILVEGFLFPTIAAWGVLRCMDVQRSARWIHIATCTMCIYCAAVGIAEVVTLQDLLPVTGGALYLDTGIGIPRANGPFQTNHSLALIGLIAIPFLSFLYKVERKQLSAWQRYLHSAGILGALVMSVLPMFRSVFLTIAAILLWQAIRRRGLARWVVVGGLVTGAALVLYISTAVPELFQERVSSGQNVYSRLAQHKQTLDMFLNHPLIGVGIGNFNSAVPMTANSSSAFGGADPLDYPHNNLGAVLAETGFPGFIAFICSQYFLVSVFWRFKKQNARCASTAWAVFACIFLGYWFTGMTLTSGYYSDLNLWYMFTLAFVYKYTLTTHTAKVSPATLLEPAA